MIPGRGGVPLWHLLATALRLALAFAGAGWYFRVHAPGAIAFPGDLPDGFRRRWRHYFYGTTFLAAVFGALLGRRRSAVEMRAFARLSALAGFFDDLTDGFSTSESAGAGSPEQFGAAADPSGLARHILQGLYRTLPPALLPEFRVYLLRVFEIEIAGRAALQMKAHSPAELEQHMMEKGGYSVLLFRRIVEAPLAVAEQEALFQLGGLVQYCDDLFDLWFDARQGIHTLVTRAAGVGSLDSLEHLLDQRMALTARAFRQTAYPAGQVEAALRVVRFLVGITRLCLEHYQFLQKKHGTLPLQNRAAMVVDMARWRNRWKAVQWVLVELRAENL